MNTNKTQDNSKDNSKSAPDKKTKANNTQDSNKSPTKGNTYPVKNTTTQTAQKDMQDKMAKLKELENRLSKSRLSLPKSQAAAHADEPQEPSPPHSRSVAYKRQQDKPVQDKQTQDKPVNASGVKDARTSQSESQNKTKPVNDEGVKTIAQSEPSRVVRVNGLRDAKWWHYMLLVHTKGREQRTERRGEGY
jgi:hypothetical protein